MRSSRITIWVMVVLSLFVLNAQAVTMEFVTVGDAGNTADTQVMTDGTAGYGSVAYEYQIGKYEITNNQYCEFLNAVAATDTYGLYLPNGDPTYNGIERNGSSGGYIYSVIAGYSDKPVIYVAQ